MDKRAVVMKPTFLILGAAKAGTTTLYHYLSEHPNVYMSELKEPVFFSEEYDKGIKFYWDKYFHNWYGQEARGEAATHNLYLPYVPERIQQTVPNARLIIILRNPVDRAYSHWWMHVLNNKENLSFENAIKRNYERLKTNPSPFGGPEGPKKWSEQMRLFEKGILKYRLYLDYGYYDEQIQHYLDLFPKSQVKVVLFEELRKNPQALVKVLWEFIGVDPNCTLRYKTPHNISFNNKRIFRFTQMVSTLKIHRAIPVEVRLHLKRLIAQLGHKPRLSKSIRKWLIEHYYTHNRKLQKILGRDLSHWNE